MPLQSLRSVQPCSVLLVDDDDLFADATADVLRSRGYEVRVAATLRAAERCVLDSFDWVVADHHLPDGSGLTLASRIDPTRTQMLLISANPGVRSGQEALRLKITDFLPKPLDLESLVAALRGGQHGQEWGATVPRARTSLFALARARCPILITGETGTGKGHLARGLHSMAGSRRPFVSVNCAAIPPTLMEAELFGVVRGAFTGAETRAGLFHEADGGTLFLDEIGDLPLPLQAKLLTFLDDRLVKPVGGSEARAVSVRVIAATNKDLDLASRVGEFRLDLLHRLDVARVELPPLRARVDFASLTANVVERLSLRDGLSYALADGEVERLAQHRWPGNIRELQNTIERSTLACPARRLVPSQFLRAAREEPVLTHALPPPKSLGEDLTLERVERDHILKVLRICNGNRTTASTMLGIGLSTLRRKLSQWGEP